MPEHEHEDSVALWVRNRADFEPKDLGISHLCSLHASGVLPITEEHQLNGCPEPQGDNCEVDPRVLTAGSPKMMPSGIARRRLQLGLAGRGYRRRRRACRRHKHQSPLWSTAQVKAALRSPSGRQPSKMIEAQSETVRASIHFGSFVSMRKTTAPEPSSIQSHDIRPFPTIGSSSKKWSR